MPTKPGVLLFLAIFGVTALHAGTAVDLTTLGGTYVGGEYTLGFEFSPVVSIAVNSLGVFDSTQGPLSSDAMVGIWDTSGDLLTSATVPSGTCATLVGYFCYVSITPFDLTAGTDYVVGSYLDALGTGLDTDEGGSGSFDPAISVVQDRYAEESTFQYPSITDDFSGGAWLGANFQFSTQSTPEPGAFVLVAGGLAGLLAWRLRRSVRGEERGQTATAFRIP